MVKVYCYSKCTTCKKALKWLDDNDIKYESLDIKEHHPDRLVAEGLPLEFITIANRRLAAINAAWASIEKNLEAA